MPKPNCYECRYRGTIPGDAHSRCLHPALGPQDDNPFGAMAALFGAAGQRTGEVAITLNVAGATHGVRRGWFLWPVNFDPTWLLTCDGFTPKGTHEVP